MGHRERKDWFPLPKCSLGGSDWRPRKEGKEVGDWNVAAGKDRRSWVKSSQSLWKSVKGQWLMARIAFLPDFCFNKL